MSGLLMMDLMSYSSLIAQNLPKRGTMACCGQLQMQRIQNAQLQPNAIFLSWRRMLAVGQFSTQRPQSMHASVTLSILPKNRAPRSSPREISTATHITRVLTLSVLLFPASTSAAMWSALAMATWQSCLEDESSGFQLLDIASRVWHNVFGI